MEEILSLTPWRTWTVLTPLGVTLFTAAFTDVRDRKIPNRLTYPAFGVGLLAHGVAFGWIGIAWGFSASLVVLFAGYFLLVLGLVGGGDVKLLAVCGAYLGFDGLGELLFYAVWAGFVLGLGYAAWKGALGSLVKRIARFLVGIGRAAVYRTMQVAESIDTDESTEVPFALAILIGGIFACTDASYGWPGLLQVFFPTAA